MHRFSLSTCRRLVSTFVDLGTRLKQLNDDRKFDQVITLFNTTVEKQQPTDYSMHQTLKACIELNDLETGSKIHRNLTSQSAKNPFIQFDLIRLYGKCGDLSKAQQIFVQSTIKTAAMYAAMLKSLSDNNRAEDALKLFQQMKIPPNEYHYSVIFSICAQLKDNRSLEFGKRVFDRMPVNFRKNRIVLNSVLRLFMQCGDISSGEKLFSQMEKDQKTYGILMSGYVTHKQPEKAIDLFWKISKPDDITRGILFSACAQLGNATALAVGKDVFNRLSNDHLGKSMKTNLPYAAFDMFIKCSDVESAERVFTQLKRNTISYGSLMNLYNTKNRPQQTLRLFEEMKKEQIETNDIIFILLINACSQIGDDSLCRSLVEQIPRSALSNLKIQTGLIDMWGKAASVTEAQKIFDTVDRADGVCYAAMINAYGLNGMGHKAVDLFSQISRDMIDECMYLCVLNACSHSGLVDEARQIFATIPFAQKKSQIYTAMVDSLSRAALFDEALKLIDQFEKDHRPDSIMYMALLSGARNCGDSSLSQKVANSMKILFPGLKHTLTPAMILLANTYGSAGEHAKASEIRTELTRSGARKEMGVSRTVINGKVVEFRANDQSHSRSDEIHVEADRLSQELIEHGYQFDPSCITRSLMSDETVQSVLSKHSERLAIAFNFIQRPIPSRIQITKNLRICSDCHRATKLIAKIRQCDIIVRDANRIHHFGRNGHCSCRDYF